MRTRSNAPLAAAALFIAALAAPSGAPVAQESGSKILDSGRLVVFSHGDPVGTEDFQFETRHDTLFVTSQANRKARTSGGAIQPYMKSMEVIARNDDWALLTYASTERFQGHTVNRSILLSDTTLTVAIEKDTYGTADKLVRLPGRIYVMDAGLFTLFDVIGRSLHGRIFGPRPVPLVALGDQNVSIDATATPAGRDTIRWGTRPVVADRITLADSTSTFTLFTGPSGSLLRLENAQADLVVMREPPAVPAVAKRHRPPKR